MAGRRRRSVQSPNSWPGFVDVLSTLLLVVVFVLLVFVTGQYYISQQISKTQTNEAVLSKQNESLQAKLTNSQRELRALQAEYQQARLSLQRQKGNVNASETAISEAELTIARLQAEIDQLQADKAILSQQGEELARTRDQYIASLQQFQQDRRALEDEQDQQSQANEAMIKRLTSLLNVNQEQAAEIDTLGIDLDAARNERRKLVGEIASLTALKAQLDQEVADQNAAIGDLEAEQARLLSRLAATRDALDQTNEALAQEQAQTRDLSVTLNRSEEDRRKLNQEIEGLIALRDALQLENERRQQELGLKEDAISQLTLRLEATDVAKRQTEDLLQQTRANLEASETDLAEQLAAYERLAQRLQGTEDQLAETQTQLARRDDQLSQTQGRLNQTLASLDQTQSQLSVTQDQLQQTQGQLDQTNAQLSQTANQLARTTDQLALREEQLSAQTVVLEGTQADLDETQNKLRARLDQLARAQALIDAQTQKATALQTELEELARLRDRQRQELADLETDLALRLTEAQDAQRLIEQKDAEALAVARQLAEREQQIADLRALLDQREQTASDLAVRLATLQQNNQDLGRQTIDLDTELTRLREDLVSKDSRMQALERQLAAVNAEKDQADAQLVSAYQNLDASKQQIQGLLADIAILRELRDRLQVQGEESATQLARYQSLLEDASKASDSQRILREDAEAKVNLLNQQTAVLRGQLARLEEALQLSQQDLEGRDVQIANLNARLNLALAEKVSELQDVQSVFLKELKDILKGEERVQVQGDRFVLQASVLFPSGSDEIAGAGSQEIVALTDKLIEISKRIPANINWVLRVDGHTDSVPVREGGRYQNNLHLSTARARAVVNSMIARGFPADRIVAAGFGDTQPVINDTTPEALAANRRIEFKLTTR